MYLIAGATAAARVRAAVAFAGIEITKWGNRGGVPQATINRIASREKPRGAHIDELWAVADECGVPRTFMVEGFGPAEQLLVERLDALTTGAAALVEYVELTADHLERQLEPDAARRVAEARQRARDSLLREDHPG